MTNREVDVPNKENMCNKRTKEHARRARKILKIYIALVGDEDEDLKTQITDLLADLMHLCKVRNQDFENPLRIARQHFSEECLGNQ